MRPVFLIIATLSSCLAPPTEHSNLKIFGGKVAEPGQFPFIVAINAADYRLQWCAGSIIHENWVLTTATCSELSVINQLVVVSGTNELYNNTGTVYNVSQIVVHPNFTTENVIYPKANIALFQINGSFVFSDLVQAVTLGDVSVNDSVVVAGWGITETSYKAPLQYAELTAWSNENCTKAAENISVIQPGEMCAFGGEGVGICGGDIGDPLIHNGTLVGIASWAIYFCGHGTPDVYTRVSYYTDWINTIIKS